MKICVALSGGVDSSVAALLLRRQGCDVFALFMQNWHNADATLHGECEWEEDRTVAELVARKLGIPFHFVDLSGPYRRRVADYMFAEYAKGRTPNPDVLCNREIKFDAFWEVARQLGADAVATGHYCRKEAATGADGQPLLAADGSPLYRLLAGTDCRKDQSYFLCRLTQEQLSRSIFPIGELEKPEVRRLAREAGLPSADKKDSQGLCFVGKVNLPTFLQQRLKPAEGEIIEVYGKYYEDSLQYAGIRALLDRLSVSGKAELITSYVSEDKPSVPEIPAPEGEASVPVGKVPVAEGQAGRAGVVDASVSGGEVPVAEGQAGTAGTPCRSANCFDAGRFAALTEEELRAVSAPMKYEFHFETETYTSGKHHLKKTRYKENPYGRIIGRHDGAQFYTIGQRKGLGIGGHRDSLFVLATDVEKNLIYVGEGHRHPGLSRSCLRLRPEEVHWIRPDLRMTDGELRRYRVRIRYRQPLQAATLLLRPSGLFLLFDEPQRGVTPGQFAVWYDGAEMLGSGVISA